MSPSNTEHETLVSDSEEMVIIKEVPKDFTESGFGWKIEDTVRGEEIELHVDDVPEMISMLRAFHSKMKERDDVAVNTTLPSDSPVRISEET